MITSIANFILDELLVRYNNQQAMNAFLHEFDAVKVEMSDEKDIFFIGSLFFFFFQFHLKTIINFF